MLELKHPVYIDRAIQSKAEQASKDTMYLSGLIPTGTLVGLCLPPALPGFPGRLTSPFQSLLSRDCSLQNHTWSGPQQVSVCWWGASDISPPQHSARSWEHSL